MAEPLKPPVSAPMASSPALSIWQWELVTGEARGEAEKPLLCYPVRLQESELWIDFERELTYEYD
jgi:hypothetical protein